MLKAYTALLCLMYRQLILAHWHCWDNFGISFAIVWKYQFLELKKTRRQNQSSTRSASSLNVHLSFDLEVKLISKLARQSWNAMKFTNLNEVDFRGIILSSSSLRQAYSAASLNVNVVTQPLYKNNAAINKLMGLLSCLPSLFIPKGQSPSFNLSFANCFLF